MSLLLISFQNCSKSDEASSTQQDPTDTQTDGFIDKRPQMRCNLLKQDGTIFIAVNSSRVNYVPGLLIQEDESFSIDCSSSRDYEGAPLGTDALFMLNNSSLINQSPLVSGSLLPGKGLKTVFIELIDLDGNAISRSVQFFPQCNALSGGTGPLQITPGIQVSNHSQDGYFQFSYTGTVSGGNPAVDDDGNETYYYAWDFNGDGTLDRQRDTNRNWNLWSDEPNAEAVYSMFSENREVLLYVYDECQNFQVISETKNFVHPSPGPEPQFFIYGDLSARNSAEANKQTDVALRAIQALNPPDRVRDHVRCSYTQRGGIGRFSIEARNSYGNPDDDVHRHSLSFDIRNIADDGSDGQVFNQVIDVDEMVYRVSGSPDGLQAYDYSQPSTAICSTHLEIIRTTSLIPCAASGGEVESVVMIFRGRDHNCSQLTKSSKPDVQYQDGSFYCEISTSDACTGGGGGGGGTPPPKN